MRSLGLRSIELAAIAEKAAMDAGRLQPFLAEQASAVRVDERHDDDLPAPDPLNVAADLLDHADRLMPHALSFDIGAAVVGPEIAAADARARDADYCVGRF